MWKTSVGAKEIAGSTLEIYGIVIAGFYVHDKFGKAGFFQETFLVADTTVKIIFKMSFLTFSKVKIDFTGKQLS